MFIQKLKSLIKHIFFPLTHYLRPGSYESKVFCIGYLKTGTTSMGIAFKLLGYKNFTFHKKTWRYYEKGKIDELTKFAEKYDSFDDLPWLLEDMIPIMDKTFPGSKFVYLSRDEESWKKSFYHWKFQEYGKYPDIESAWKDYKNHEKFVMSYFKDRTSDFLSLRITDQGAFEKLAGFLGKKAPFREFPHYNKTSYPKNH